MADVSADRAAALALTPVSRETEARLDKLVALLTDRQQTLNLVAASTLPTVWTRHIADSLQLLRLAPDATAWVDLGSGGGFPALPLACALADRTGGAHITMVESTGKKAAFLSETVAALSLPASVHAERVEDFAKRRPPRFDIVTARALAPLPKLLGLAAPFLQGGTQALLHKGQDVDAELTEASKSWNMDVDLVPSLTNPQARIVVVHSLKPRKPK